MVVVVEVDWVVLVVVEAVVAPEAKEGVDLLLYFVCSCSNRSL